MHTLWMLGAALTWIHLQVMWRPGQDAHAYWAAWQGDPATDMYDGAPATPDAFNYAPVFAQLVRPLAYLPWPVFGVLWSVAVTAALVWLLRPLGWRWVGPLVLCCSLEIISGNIFALLAVAAVLGLGDRPRSGAAWVVPGLTKITPTLGPLWFLVRGEWRHLLVGAATTAAVVAVSWTISPGLWADWLAFLLRYEQSTQPVGSAYVPALLYRLPVAVVLTVYAARSDRRWLVPVAMVLAVPVTGPAALVMLAAIPRLRAQRPAKRSGPQRPAKRSGALSRVPRG